jgi:hypothetical protein
MADEPEGRAPGSGGGASILTKKTGPLPNWVWMGVVLLAALIYALWRRNQAAAQVEEGPDVEDVPGDQTPPPVFILPQNPQPTVPVNVTVNNPTTPPTAPPVGNKPPVTTPPPTAKPPLYTTGPNGSHFVVSVAKYTTKNPPWNSTLSGIAGHTWGAKNAPQWSKIWNDPVNAKLKAKRGDPKKIQPGDTIYVRKKM